MAGIVLYCLAGAFGAAGGCTLLTPGTGGGIIATGVLIWLRGALSLSLEL
ncbi:MAG: hypothetical protein Kow0026_04370 [Oricola sp.]